MMPGEGEAKVAPTATVINLEADAAAITATAPITWATGDVLEVDIVVALDDETGT